VPVLFPVIIYWLLWHKRGECCFMKACKKWIFSCCREHKWLVFVMFIMLAGRLAISGQGYLEDSDEVDYYAAEDAYEALLQLDIKSFSNNVAITEGKPTETLLKVTQVPVHRLWAFLINTPLYSPKGLWILGLISIFTSLAVLLVFYRLLLALNFTGTASLLGVFTLGIFINYNLYTRHLLSYDLGLLFTLLSLLCVVTAKDESLSNYKYAGLLAALGFSSYHGYFMLIAIIGGYIVFRNGTEYFTVKQKLKAFGLAFGTLLLGYEVFFWIGGNSFIKECIKIGGSIGQGSFTEGFIYAGLYMQMVEGPVGVALLVLALVGILLVLIKPSRQPVPLLLMLALTAYLSYGFATYVLWKFVFYGRILHMYYPFMVIGALFVLQRIRVADSKVVGLALVLPLGLQYYLNIKELNSFTYPRKVLDDYGWAIRDSTSYNIQFLYELDYTENYVSNTRFSRDAVKYFTFPPGTYYIVNTCFFQHHPDRFIATYAPARRPNGGLLFSKLHFMSYPAYTLEYCSNTGREFYLDKQFKIEIFREYE
jgi:hypothetical protein